MNRHSNLAQLRSLFDAVCDEVATDEQLQQFEDLVDSDEQACRLYMEQCQLHADLYSTISGQRSQETIRENIVADRAASPSPSDVSAETFHNITM